MPVTYSKSRGIYRSFRWGKNLEVFFLDERSFRDPGADDGGTCDNPQGSGNRDFAPTAPQRTRATFAADRARSSPCPPPPGCLERINDPNRHYLGTAQFDRFTKAVKRSKATFKVVMNELPIQQFYVDPYDRWEGYAAERTRLIEFLRDNVRNVVFLTADVHANLVNDVRLKTLEDGGPVDCGILEVTSGPSGTDSFKDDINDDTGNPQVGDLANTFFLRQQPPDGPGIRCSNLDVFSYGQVTVTSRVLTIALKDAKGKTVTDPDGKPAGRTWWRSDEPPPPPGAARLVRLARGGGRRDRRDRALHPRHRAAGGRRALRPRPVGARRPARGRRSRALAGLDLAAPQHLPRKYL